MDPKKVDTVLHWPPLRNVKEIMSFLGMTGYYRRFVKDYSKIATPLSNLMRKDEPFRWDEPQVKAFNTLKTLISEKPILTIPSPDFPFVLHTDASGGAVGGHSMESSCRISPRVSNLLPTFQGR